MIRTVSGRVPPLHLVPAQLTLHTGGGEKRINSCLNVEEKCCLSHRKDPLLVRRRTVQGGDAAETPSDWLMNQQVHLQRSSLLVLLVFGFSQGG